MQENSYAHIHTTSTSANEAQPCWLAGSQAALATHAALSSAPPPPHTHTHGAASQRMHPSTHASKHACIQARMHPSTHASKYACIQARMHPSTHASKYACIQAECAPSNHGSHQRSHAMPAPPPGASHHCPGAAATALIDPSGRRRPAVQVLLQLLPLGWGLLQRLGWPCPCWYPVPCARAWHWPHSPAMPGIAWRGPVPCF